MKVTAINGSPRKNGSTYAALGVIAGVLKEEGIDCGIIQVGSMDLSGCNGCGGCSSGKCVIDDGLNEVADEMKKADGIIVGSPVYYAGISGTLKCFLDRAFYSAGGNFRFKPAAGVVAMRRAGGTAALQTINQYFEITEMLITPTIYWSGIHGMGAEQIAQDKEGVQMLEVIGRNMAYLIKLKASAAVTEPSPLKEKIRTNFIR